MVVVHIDGLAIFEEITHQTGTGKEAFAGRLVVVDAPHLFEGFPIGGRPKGADERAHILVVPSTGNQLHTLALRSECS